MTRELVNERPILLNCFSRGGSSILWNLFMTHPDVSSPMRETLQIFRIGRTRPTLSGYRAALLTRQPKFFDQWNLRPRRSINESAMRFIDRELHRGKMSSLNDVDMRFVAEGVPYTTEQLAATRLVAKNNNGLAFLSDLWREMYPSSVQFALLRNPVPLFEGHRRRGITRSPVRFARFYRRIVQRMIDDAERTEEYYLLRFEDLLAYPRAMMLELHAAAGLPSGRVERIRLKAKAHSHPDGSRTIENYEVGRHFWLTEAELVRFLEPGVNHHQATRLSDSDIDSLESVLGDLTGRLGYGNDHDRSLPFIVPPASRSGDTTG